MMGSGYSLIHSTVLLSFVLVEPRTSYNLGKLSTTELSPQPVVLFCYETVSHCVALVVPELTIQFYDLEHTEIHL